SAGGASAASSTLPSVSEDHRGDVVALRRALGELPNVAEERLQQLRRLEREVLLDALDDPAFAVLVPTRRQRLRDAVAEDDQPLPRLERDGFLLEGRPLEEAHDRAAALQAAQPARSGARNDQRRIVAGVAVGQLPVRAERAVHQRDEA